MDLDRINRLCGLDFLVEHSSPEELVIASFNDDPPPYGGVRCRLRFARPVIVDIPETFSHRVISEVPIADVPSSLAASLEGASGLHAFLFIDQSEPPEAPGVIVASELTIGEQPFGGGDLTSR